MQKFSFNKQRTVIRFPEEGKKFISEFAITDSVKYTTKEWVTYPGMGKFYKMVDTDAETFKMFQITVGV